ncbi:hypothetical protein M9B41_06970 [SAR86 cluster bacterium]|nr:hypothetical protein M9B41_06970 [SAR86 cluster bacterium]
MSERDYPERLKIYKEKEDNEKQDHYLVVVDKDGNPVSSTETKWYPIDSGYLDISISSISLSSYFSQDGGRQFTHQSGDEEIEINQDKRLEGEGRLERGTPNTPLSPNISHFGNSNKYNHINVLITDQGVELDHFHLFGFKSDVDIGYSQTEEFTLQINLKKERFEELKSIVENDSIEKIYISIWLGNLPGLYSTWWSFEGSSFGDIKYFDYKNPKHILNKEDFDEGFINSLDNRINNDLGSGVDFTISTKEKVGSFPLTKTPHEKEQLELEKNWWSEENNKEEDDGLLTDFPLSTEEKEEIRRNQELNLEKQKVSILLSIFWGVVVIGVLLLLTLWFR